MNEDEKKKEHHVKSNAWLTGIPIRLIRSDVSMDPKHTLRRQKSIEVTG